MVISMEELYEEIVIYCIERANISLDDKCNYMIDFHRNSNQYYDLLCDYSYLLSTNESVLPLWISLNGQPRLSLKPLNASDVKVLDPKSVPGFNGDLIECLTVILHNLSKGNKCVDVV